MDNGVLVVNFAALEQARADINKALSRLESELEQLERDAAPLMSSWEGVAKAAYAARQTKWRNAARELSTTLRNIEAALDASTRDYLTTEKRAANLFQ
jgi:early secretory antigenic target protein ESAT-6